MLSQLHYVGGMGQKEHETQPSADEEVKCYNQNQIWDK